MNHLTHPNSSTRYRNYRHPTHQRPSDTFLRVIAYRILTLSVTMWYVTAPCECRFHCTVRLNSRNGQA